MAIRAMRRAEAVKIDVITIFPEYFSPLRISLLGKAAERGLIEFAVHDLRTWAHDLHKSVDDTPFGGGPGMVMSPVPWGEALDAVLGPLSPGTRLVVPSPAGEPFRQETAATYSRTAQIVFACGRYEGIDARFAEDARTRVPVDEVSVGDYVLSGGEPAVLVMIDAICRLLPGVLGNAASAPDDSFGAGGGSMAGLLEGPVFTRPRVWRGVRCPRSCSPGTMPPSRGGGATRRCAAPRPCGPISWRCCPQVPWMAATGRCSMRLAFRSRAKIWHTETAASRKSHRAGMLFALSDHDRP